MDKKKLGRTKLQTPPIVFGGNVFGWTLDEKESLKLLDKIYERGFTFIDTADSYSHWAPGNSGGESETIIGKWMKDRGLRDKVSIATKVGSNPGKEGRDVSKKYILKAAEDSLRRLQTDYIDLYFTHWDNEATPVEETLEAYQQLLKEGKIRNIGASNLSPARLRESFKAAEHNDLPQYKVLQPEYNLVERENFEYNYRPIAEEYDLAVMPYFSLASGFLTGKYRKEEDLQGDRKEMVKKYFNEKGLNLLKQMDEIAKNHQVSNAAVALAWLIHQPAVTAPIASATKESHLKAFDQAIGLELTPEELERLS
ncbi:aldo/keto reductase [Salinimicrobium xinjiangense]|uniref:aldo/keto reductase n=1 Tax=Salinimicrobium xinjiangense TaxID=438596 RepID=UPI000420C43A|nr:aldo/keto reductase [Salinimicrobium xinjiangense]